MKNVFDLRGSEEEVVLEKPSRATTQMYVQGRLPFVWIRNYISSPPDRLLLVLSGYSDMKRSRSFKLSKKILTEAGIECRQVCSRALKQLENLGAIEVERKPGARPIVTLKHPPGRMKKSS